MLDLYRGAFIGTIAWAPLETYSSEASVTTEGGTTHPSVTGDTPR